MADVQAASGMVDLVVKGITIILLIVAASTAIKKKNNLAFGVAVVGNLVVYFFTQSPLLCWIVSIACIIWASLTKKAEKDAGQDKKQSNPPAEGNKKIGNIIGVILGVGFVVGPLIAYVNQEASTGDSTTQGLLILFAVIGGFMIINNIFKLIEKTPSAPEPSNTAAAVKQTETKPAKEKSETETKKIRCRFCKKLYSSEYNGCPYCKKK